MEERKFMTDDSVVLPPVVCRLESKTLDTPTRQKDHRMRIKQGGLVLR